ncbi:unnamed protein product [Umbelopsis sp. WA50703]
MDQRRPSISEASVASEDLASKDLPSRSYFSSHAQPDIAYEKYSASIEAIRKQSLALGNIALEDSEGNEPAIDLASPRSISPPSAESGSAPQTSNLSLLLQHASRITPPPTPKKPVENTPLLSASSPETGYHAVNIASDNSTPSSPPVQSTATNNKTPRRSMRDDSRRESSAWTHNIKRLKMMRPNDIWREAVVVPVGYLPAVILGLLLNLLDAISYGMITFPASNPIFANFGPDGISMFFVSCIIAQLTYSCGGSVFSSGNGSMMIEVVPFLHIMADAITRQIGEDKPHQVIATTITAFAISSIMTGAAFYILGALKLGSLIGFFPRHILVGTIGGVGWFLVATGIEVSGRLEGGMVYDIPTMKEIFLNTHTLLLWTSALCVALLLRALQHKIKHPLLVPTFFMLVPIIFWFVILVARLDVDQVRADGWIFPLVEGDVPFWHFYTYYDFTAIDWAALSSTIPAMLALTFFGVLHVPINVPALGVSTNQDDVDVNKELVAHGISNTLSGCVGSVQNYLVYTNSLLFIKSGGDSRLSGLMLAAATTVLWVAGPGIVGYIPIMVVGALIFHLGLDLLKEALVDTWGNLHHFEYITICAIIFFMAWLGFVEGIFLGIVMACVFFVVTNSKRGAVRGVYTGQTFHSTVRRLYRQQKFLSQVGNQIMIVLLQGYLFFGTIGQVESCIRDALDQRAWEQNPIRFLVLDLKLVQGIDFSASEAFVRLKRLLTAKDVYLVLCNVDIDTEIGHALWKAGLMQAEEEGTSNVRCFAILNEALEWCENILLQTYYAKHAALAQHRRHASITSKGDGIKLRAKGISDAKLFLSLEAVKSDTLGEGEPLRGVIASSPRQNMLVEAVQKVFNDSPVVQSNMAQPIAIMTQAFGELSSRANPDMYMHLAPYFKRVTFPTGTVLWQPGDESCCLYIVEKGLLRSSMIETADDSERHQVMAQESILPGTIVGELGLFTELPRTKSLTVDQDSVLWKLSKEDFNRMLEQEPKVANGFICMALNFSAERLKLVSSFAFELN